MPNVVSYNANHVIKGPGRLWLNTALPASPGRITLDANGNPDGTESPNAIFLGMTREGCTFTETYTEQGQTCDELTAPYRTDIDAEAGTLEGEFLEVLNFQRLAKLAPNGVYSAVTGVGAYSQITFGGVLTVVNVPVVLIAPQTADPTKFVVVQLYAAHNTAGIKLGLTKKKDAGIPFKLEAMIVPGRAAGDQLATIWKQD
ncbi:MAG: hypothetical protein AUG51_19355 [Acidobacteria bacterium 13_1_20CM_3_53_8]|nr:MAG: hypothetical protein AUG51_19355 [Acidobacteria bacterium 13_1_20CM_3_53_8]